MTFTVAQIAAALGTEAAGDTSITIGAPAEPADAGPGDLAMAMSPKYADGLKQGQARVALLWPGADWQALGLEAAIFAPRPRMAMSGVTALMDPGQRFGEGIHPTAVVDPSAELGEDVSVGPMTVIGPGARIGDGSAIGPLCYVGAGAVLGAQAYLRESVSIGANVQIGDRFIAQPGARIGSDGFSFVTPEVSGVELARETMGDQGDTAAQSWIRIHSLGGVVIGDDVEIGANSTVDSGTVRRQGLPAVRSGRHRRVGRRWRQRGAGGAGRRGRQHHHRRPGHCRRRVQDPLERARRAHDQRLSRGENGHVYRDVQGAAPVAAPGL